jgi:hypothetical protein
MVLGLLVAITVATLLMCDWPPIDSDPLTHRIPSDWRAWRGDSGLSVAIAALPPDGALRLVRWLVFAREAQLSGHPVSSLTVREALEVDPATLTLTGPLHPGVATSSPLDVGFIGARWLP